MALDSFNTQCAVQSVGALDTLVSTLVQALLVAQCGISKPEYWPQDYADAALLPGGLDGFDYVVVGAGSAGSVVASRLSENPNAKVLVLEAGGDPPLESEVPALFLFLQNSDFNWNYWTEPTGKTSLANVNQSCYWPRGKTIGGSGAINAMLYVRGNRKDYDGWMKQGNPGWGWDDVLPYFEKSLRPAGNASMPQGYIAINEAEYFYQHFEEMIFSAAKELGIPRVARFDEGTETGYSILPGTVQNGQRMSTGKGYLGRVSGRPNLRVIKNAVATRINFNKSGKTVDSVSFVLRNNQTLQVNIKKELVLSAGTIDSAKLLLLSGVGPKKHLRSLKIPVLHDLPVGENLQDHVVVPVFFELETNTADPLTEQQALDGIYDYLIHRRGPLSSHFLFALTGFINTVEGSSSPYPDIEYHYFLIQRGDYFALDLYIKSVGFSEEYGQHLLNKIRSSSILVVMNILAHPKSSGNIKLRSTDYHDTPKLFANYLEEPEDEQTLLRGIHHLMKMEQTQAFVAKDAHLVHIPITACDQHEFKSDSYWLCYMRYFTITMYHLAGTVKMGPASDRKSCVSPRLLLHGVNNLRVADASIMPKVTGCNTNAPTIMIGEKAADLITENSRRPRRWSEKYLRL